jgi:hypothetical protein
MAYLFHLASIITLSTRSNGPLSRNDKFLLCKFYNFKATLDLLVGPSPKFISLGTMNPIKANLISGKKCIA